MNLPKMFEQGLTVKESLVTELTKRMPWEIRVFNATRVSILSSDGIVV